MNQGRTFFRIIMLIIGSTIIALLMGCKKNNKDPYTIELIPSFEEGFRLTGYDSRIKENHDIGRLDYGKKSEITDWRIGQWGCINNLLNATHTKRGNTDIYFDGAKTLEIDNDTGGFVLGIDGSKDFIGNRTEGQEWPHFILEVMPFRNPVCVKDINFLEFYLEFELTKEVNKTTNFNPDLHTALFIWYITLNDYGPDGRTRDYFWFGLPIYDYRHDFSPFFAQQDSGKEDRTDKFIVNLAGDTFLSDIVGLNIPQYMHFDAYEALEEAYNLAVRRGFLKGTKFENMCIGSMYIGWELPGSFDVSMSVYNISIKTGIR